MRQLPGLVHAMPPARVEASLAGPATRGGARSNVDNEPTAGGLSAGPVPIARKMTGTKMAATTKTATMVSGIQYLGRSDIAATVPRERPSASRDGFHRIRGAGKNRVTSRHLRWGPLQTRGFEPASAPPIASALTGPGRTTVALVSAEIAVDAAAGHAEDIGIRSAGGW